MQVFYFISWNISTPVVKSGYSLVEKDTFELTVEPDTFEKVQVLAELNKEQLLAIAEDAKCLKEDLLRNDN